MRKGTSWHFWNAFVRRSVWRSWSDCAAQQAVLDLSRLVRIPTLWTLRKVSTRITLSIPRRLTRTETVHLLWIFCFRNHYSVPLSPLRRNVSAQISLCGLWRLIRAIHNAEAIMLVFSLDGSSVLFIKSTRTFSDAPYHCMACRPSQPLFSWISA